MNKMIIEGVLERNLLKMARTIKSKDTKMTEWK